VQGKRYAKHIDKGVEGRSTNWHELTELR